VSDKPLSPEAVIRLELERLKKLADEATPGPWTWDDWSQDGGPDKFTLQAPPEARRDGPSTMFPDLHEHIITDEDHEISEADKALIADARTSVPKLVEALEIATTRLEMIRDAAKRNISAEDAANGAMQDAREGLAGIALKLKEKA
jgi:hypothetical protein